MITLLNGDALEMLRGLEDCSVQCCVTSPPYFGLRDYGCAGQIGLETTPAEFIARLVGVFGEVRRVLRKDGTLWVNMGDSYANDGKWGGSSGGKHAKALHGDTSIGRTRTHTGLKPKELMGMPWRLAFALQDAGWYLRQDIIWSKPNPMPESVLDRCTKAHEYLFLLSKSPRYLFDAAAIAEQSAPSSVARIAQDIEAQNGSDRVPGKPNGPMKAVRSRRDSFKREASKRAAAMHGQDAGTHREDRPESAWDIELRNKRSVWTVATMPYAEAHFATYPPELIRPCIMAGSRPGDTVLDPFSGAATTGLVALQEGRRYVGIELNPDYQMLAEKRLRGVQMPLPLAPAQVAA